MLHRLSPACTRCVSATGVLLVGAGLETAGAGAGVPVVVPVVLPVAPVVVPPAVGAVTVPGTATLPGVTPGTAGVAALGTSDTNGSRGACRAIAGVPAGAA